MTVADLIRALQGMPPAKTVKVVLSSVTSADEHGDFEIDLNDSDALEADQVLDIGACVVIRSR